MRASILLLGLLIFLSGCAVKAKDQKSDSQLQDQKTLALASYYRKNYKQALEDLREAEKINRRDPGIYNIEGLVYFSIKDYENSKKAYKKALSLDKDYTEVRFNLCGLHLTLSEWEDAVKQCKKATTDKFYKSRDRAYTSLGVAYFKAGVEQGSTELIAMAEQSFRDALEVNPVLVYTYNEMGKLYIYQGLEDEALGAFKQAVTGFDMYDEAHYNLAQLYMSRGELKLACKHFARVYEIAPGTMLGLNAKNYVDTVCVERKRIRR